ncbi:hypothetical protein E1A91_D11G193500v1 [Gossypium mustelinum]|uniref:Uncharacterized protein n=1 Tax=Gossypium mustelinum TaxID=34275 RepID=A0A5D2SWA6_GOSMU|nr:hypothetical protein E1A91_D11G193500v1 [Gossypium mustelinum]
MSSIKRNGLTIFFPFCFFFSSFPLPLFSLLCPTPTTAPFPLSLKCIINISLSGLGFSSLQVQCSLISCLRISY